MNSNLKNDFSKDEKPTKNKNHRSTDTIIKTKVTWKSLFHVDKINLRTRLIKSCFKLILYNTKILSSTKQLCYLKLDGYCPHHKTLVFLVMFIYGTINFSNLDGFNI